MIEKFNASRETSACYDHVIKIFI